RGWTAPRDQRECCRCQQKIHRDSWERFLTEDGMDASRIIRTVVSLPIREAFVMQKVIGLDIAKRVFQLHSVDPQTGEIERRKLSRGELLEHFARLSPATIAMEACSS